MKKLIKNAIIRYQSHLSKDNEKIKEGYYFPLDLYECYIICLKVEEVQNAHAYVYTDKEDKNFVFVFDENIETHVVVHEVGHLTFHILEDKNIPIDYHNQETFCYLLDYLYKEIMKLLATNKKRWRMKKL